MREPTERPAWSVYLLRCADGTLYCGITNDVPRRLAAHGRGAVKYTRGRLPVKLAHLEPAADRSGALKREAALKRLSRAQKLRLVSKKETAFSPPATCTSAPNSLSKTDAKIFAYRSRSRSGARRGRLR
jgi:putative endonuclease